MIFIFLNIKYISSFINVETTNLYVSQTFHYYVKKDTNNKTKE